jgi:hypothetical protein
MKMKLMLTLLAALVLFADSASVAQNFWEPASGPAPGQPVAIAVSPNGSCFVANGGTFTTTSTFGSLFKTDDKGKTWTSVTDFKKSWTLGDSVLAGLPWSMKIASNGSIFV